jgi:hypothetical protein
LSVEQHSLWVTWDSDDEPYVHRELLDGIIHTVYRIYSTHTLYSTSGGLLATQSRRCSNLHDRGTR